MEQYVLHVNDFFSLYDNNYLQLCALDLRYPTAREPIMEFRGHVNKLSRTLVSTLRADMADDRLMVV